MFSHFRCLVHDFAIPKFNAFSSANVAFVMSPVFSNNLKREMFLHRREDPPSVTEHILRVKTFPVSVHVL